MSGQDEVIAAVDAVQVLKQRLMHKDEVVIHLQQSGFSFLKDHDMQSFVVDVIRRFQVPSQVFYPFLDPFLVNQVQYVSVFFVLLELMVSRKLGLSSLIWLHLDHFEVLAPFNEAFLELYRISFKCVQYIFNYLKSDFPVNKVVHDMRSSGLL